MADEKTSDKATDKTADKAAEDVPYQVVPQVEQLRAERANAEAYGQTDRVAAIDKQLEGLGVPAQEKKSAAEKRAAAAKDDDEARSTPPQSRSAKPTQKA